MLADPILINTTVNLTEYLTDTDMNVLLSKGEYAFPIERKEAGVYETGLNFNIHIGNLCAYKDWSGMPDLDDDMTEEQIQEKVKRYQRAGSVSPADVRRWCSKNEVGVADNYQQVLAAYPLAVQHPTRRFCLSVTPIRRSEAPAKGGWRWKKWGRYLGTQEPAADYIADEPIIEEVVVFRWYELQDKNAQ